MLVRYSGLRREDFNEIMERLIIQFSNEIGPPRERESNQLHEKWVYFAGGIVRGLKTTFDGLQWVGI